ncbi:MAG: efflux transporter periplasmic adaptor subunit, partial [Gammaproteobacteria bacterium]|nr:efflux transporter periplasmic adaptor subunit [Gammaproteobacteria bacterium]
AKLFPGMLVKTVFVTGEREALLLPRDSIARRGEVTAAYVEGPGGALQFRQLRIGRDLDGRVEILAGLAANEKVALDPVAAAAAMKQQATREGGDE